MIEAEWWMRNMIKGGKMTNAPWLGPMTAEKRAMLLLRHFQFTPWIFEHEREQRLIAAIRDAEHHARQQALEEAAKLAEKRWRDWKEPDCKVDSDITACADIADTIRALIKEPGR